jgi:hypothetical protein
VAAMRWKVLFSQMFLPWRIILPQAQSNKTKWSWTKTSETMSQNKPVFLLSWLSQVFCHSNEKLTNTENLQGKIRSKQCRGWIFIATLMGVLVLTNCHPWK